MKPNGLVAAAPTTSQTSICIRSQSCASSFTSAMLTERKMFSRSFVSSAASGDETGWTVSRALPYSSAARSVQAGVIPPTIFGVFFVVQSSRPGSTRSGENARWKSSPALSPLFSRIGSSRSRVVPGYVVDSSTTSCPFCRRGTMSSTAPRTTDRSGSRCAERGVWSAIRIACASFSAS